MSATTPRPPSRRPRPPGLPRHVWVLLSMSLVSCLGSGLTLPFLLVYLHGLRHVSLATTGLCLALPAVVGLLVTPLTGTLLDLLGPRVVLVGSFLLAATGSALLAGATSAPGAVGPLVAYGLGDAGLLTGVTTLLAQLVRDEAAQVRAYSIEFTLVNVGVGAGALVAGSVVSLGHPWTFTLVYLLDAASFLVPGVVTAFMAMPGARTRRSGTSGSTAPRPGGEAGALRYRQVLADPRLLRYAALTALLGICGYGALDAAFVGYSSTVVHATPSLIADAFAVNTGLIVVFQHLATRVVVRVRRSRALAFAAAAFGAAWVLEWLAGRHRGEPLGDALVVAFGGVFALGEMAVSPVRGVIVNALASDEARGRYNAVRFVAVQAANVATPAMIGALLGAALGGPMLLGLVGVAVASGAYALALGRHLSDAQDNRRRAPVSA